MPKWLGVFRVGFGTCTAVCVAVGVCIWVLFRQQLPPVVPWLYSLPWGESQLVNNTWLLMAPGLCLGVAAACGPVAAKLAGDKVLMGLVLCGGMVFQVMVTLALLRVVLIVT